VRFPDRPFRSSNETRQFKSLIPLVNRLESVHEVYQVTKLSQHESDGRESEKGQRIAAEVLKIFDQAAATIGRVGDWRAGLGRCLCSPLARPFVCECHKISTMPRFQPPPHRTQRANFWHYAHLFASPQSLWDLSCRDSFPRGSTHPIVIE
jgi:hypothetical protein